MKGKFALFALALLLILGSASAQNGTPHGILWTITPPATIGGSGTLQGYYLFTCAGSGCTNYTAVGGLIAATSQTAATTYLQAASTLTANTTYEAVAVDVDSNGNESAYSAVATVAVTTLPTNPNSPSCSGKVQ